MRFLYSFVITQSFTTKILTFNDFRKFFKNRLAIWPIFTWQFDGFSLGNLAEEGEAGGAVGGELVAEGGGGGEAGLATEAFHE